MQALQAVEGAEDLDIDGGHENEQEDKGGQLLQPLGDHGGDAEGHGQHHIEDQGDHRKHRPALGDAVLQLQIQGSDPFEGDQSQQGTEEESCGEHKDVLVAKEEIQHGGDVYDLQHQGVCQTEGEEKPSVPMLCDEPEEDQTGEAAGEQQQGTHFLRAEDKEQDAVHGQQGYHGKEGQPQELFGGEAGFEQHQQDDEAEKGCVDQGNVSQNRHRLSSLFVKNERRYVQKYDGGRVVRGSDPSPTIGEAGWGVKVSSCSAAAVYAWQFDTPPQPSPIVGEGAVRRFNRWWG